ncbi:DUF393 domain-containing protein [Leptolyngbya sp. NK1-12]|uniref:DUF393 domain-containing protein n=1 Tax=Leptolyngbya sp. NK1-12 TaxID=2547451 RepID=A0AA96WDH8_9CYAN|nr:DUF393 domain-containing protein [Elainella sp. C42_A2020_010]WNZ24247.1 DUF393 domain-containing protein [Leptolyngbya sp. NK1-12]
MIYHVIYDGNCNLCVNSVKLLEQLDQGKQFRYAPMQDQTTLAQFGITPEDCQLGIILIQSEPPFQRWQGTAAIEEIGCLLPLGDAFVTAYQQLPGAKWVGDRLYEQIRDHRYMLFGQRPTYHSPYPIASDGLCADGGCADPIH